MEILKHSLQATHWVKPGMLLLVSNIFSTNLKVQTI